jgi:hypothetical protein
MAARSDETHSWIRTLSVETALTDVHMEQVCTLLSLSTALQSISLVYSVLTRSPLSGRPYLLSATAQNSQTSLQHLRLACNNFELEFMDLGEIVQAINAFTYLSSLTMFSGVDWSPAASLVLPNLTALTWTTSFAAQRGADYNFLARCQFSALATVELLAPPAVEAPPPGALLAFLAVNPSITALSVVLMPAEWDSLYTVLPALLHLNVHHSPLSAELAATMPHSLLSLVIAIDMIEPAGLWAFLEGLATKSTGLKELGVRAQDRLAFEWSSAWLLKDDRGRMATFGSLAAYSLRLAARGIGLLDQRGHTLMAWPPLSLEQVTGPVVPSLPPVED